MFFTSIVILGLIALGLLFSPLFGFKKATSLLALVPLVLIALVTIFSSATTVDARAVGIETSFGKYRATLDSGLHWTAPWASVEQFSTQIQPLNFDVPVSFDGGSSGSATLTVRWSIDEKGAEKLWKDWKTFDRVRDNLVKSETREQANTVISVYSPEAARDGGNRSQMQADIVKALTTRLGSRGVHVDSVSVTDINLGKQAQASLDRIVSANADVDKAKADQERAKIDAETAQIRQTTQTPETLQRYCLDVVNAWDVKKNGPLPATFNCQLDATSQTPVIIGQ